MKSDKVNTNTDPDQSMIYQIRLKGCLAGQWSEWFGGMIVTLEESGDTLLTGPVKDQAALHGLLKQVRDLGIPLISVNRFYKQPGRKQASLVIDFVYCSGMRPYLLSNESYRKSEAMRNDLSNQRSKKWIQTEELQLLPVYYL